MEPGALAQPINGTDQSGSDPRMIRVAMRQSSQVLLPMTDPLMSISQPFAYLTRAVSVGTTLSKSCSYFTRAVSVGIVF